MKQIFATLLFARTLCGCGTTPVEVMRYTSERFAPTEPSSVKIIRTRLERRSYIEIGEVSIRLNRQNQEDSIALLRQRAAELGADAIILMGERSLGAAAMPIGSLTVAVPLREIYGIAIKYR